MLRDWSRDEHVGRDGAFSLDNVAKCLLLHVAVTIRNFGIGNPDRGIFLFPIIIPGDFSNRNILITSK